MEKYLSYFGQRLRQLRNRDGLTQAELARRLGVGQGHVATLESAKEGRQPSLGFLLAVSDLFHVGIDDLLGTHINGQIPVNDVDMLPEDVREPIQQLISSLSREAREKRWRSQSDLTMAIGGPVGVAIASRSLNTVVAPNDNGMILEKV